MSSLYKKRTYTTYHRCTHEEPECSWELAWMVKLANNCSINLIQNNIIFVISVRASFQKQFHAQGRMQVGVEGVTTPFKICVSWLYSPTKSCGEVIWNHPKVITKVFGYFLSLDFQLTSKRCFNFTDFDLFNHGLYYIMDYDLIILLCRSNSSTDFLSARQRLVTT